MYTRKLRCMDTLKALNIPKEDFVIYGSAPMVLRGLKEKNNDSDIYQIFLGNMDDRYLINSTDEQQVIDYIAGMTDDYFINQYEKIKEEV